MAVSKIVYKSSPSATPVTWMDLTADSVTAGTLLSGETATKADGTRVTGTFLGKEFISQTVTMGSTTTWYKFEFGKTINSYLYLIEMTDESKATFISSGGAYSKPFALVGVFPKRQINGLDTYNNVSQRYKPSTGEASGAVSQAWTTASTYISNNVGAYNDSSGTNNFLQGYTYKFTIISLE